MSKIENSLPDDYALRQQGFSLLPTQRRRQRRSIALAGRHLAAAPNADLGLGGEWLARGGEQAIKAVQIERRVLAVTLYVIVHYQAQDRLAVRDRALDRGVVGRAPVKSVRRNRMHLAGVRQPLTNPDISGHDRGVLMRLHRGQVDQRPGGDDARD